MKRGVTIVELLVAMAIFIVVVTLAVGAFATVSRMKALTSTMKESQQKSRVALEMVTRLSRQAEKVEIDDAGKILDLYFDIKSASPQGVRFEIVNNELLYSECSGSLTCVETEQTNLYEGVQLLEDSGAGKDSKFTKVGSIPPTLSIELYSSINNNGDAYYSDDLDINTTIILENIR